MMSPLVMANTGWESQKRHGSIGIFALRSMHRSKGVVDPFRVTAVESDTSWATTLFCMSTMTS